MKIFDKKFKSIIALSVCLLLLVGFVYAVIDRWDTGFSLPAGETKNVYVGSNQECHEVINTSANSSYFVPTKTTTEWNAFSNAVDSNASLGLAIGECCVPDCPDRYCGSDGCGGTCICEYPYDDCQSGTCCHYNYGEICMRDVYDYVHKYNICPCEGDALISCQHVVSSSWACWYSNGICGWTCMWYHWEKTGSCIGTYNCAGYCECI